MEKVTQRLNKLRLQSSEKDKDFEVKFFRIYNPEELLRFEEVLNFPGLDLYDSIEEQVVELVKFRHPSRSYTAEELCLESKKFIGNLSFTEYGVWVYYSWSNRLVHMLDKNEFIELRTSRNQYKITPEERNVMMTKKIGVIGLSVGQSVAVTLAMERICSELRLADFDLLELTNLNRIRTGVHNLGLGKVYSVAREIAEIDPFISVRCFPEGLRESNMDAFFCEGGKLDLLIEESDGFDIKILSRYKARDLKIPVLSEASDRCMVDVERFDLEPKRSILHGLADHLDVATLKDLKTTEQKIPYMLDILGIETASLRLKASMLEIEQSINTWPQLASAVTMGGGITADVARRILLKQFNESGRYFVDIEELISDKKFTKEVVTEKNNTEVLNFVELAKKVSVVKQEGQLSLSKKQIEILVNTACLAPSGGNSQPWRWVYKEDGLLLFNAFDANVTMLGYDNLPSYVSIGAAIENIVLKAGELKLSTTAELFPDKKIKDLVAIFRFFKTDLSAPINQTRVNAIYTRLTNRKLSLRENIDAAILNELVASAAEVDGAQIRFFTDTHELNEIAELLGDLEKIRLLEEMGHRDFVDEIRWTVEENDHKRDGVDLRTLDITNAERVGLQVSKDKHIIDLVRKWNGGGAFKKLTRKSVDSAGAIGIITMKGNTFTDFLNGGRAVQKVWLDANALGIAFQPMASAVFIYARLLRGGGKGLSEKGIKKLKELRPHFESVFQLKPNSGEIFIFRLSKAAEPEIKSLRKPLEDIFCYL